MHPCRWIRTTASSAGLSRGKEADWRFDQAGGGLIGGTLSPVWGERAQSLSTLLWRNVVARLAL